MDQDKQENYERARALRDEVNRWVDREFNFINVAVFEACDECFYENIRQQPIEDFVDDYFYSLGLEAEKELKEEIAEYYAVEVEDLAEGDIDEYLKDNREEEIRDWVADNGYDDNYPVWSTVFEFKTEPPSDWLDKAQEAGLGVIDAHGHFNSALFSTSAGHSFYSSYWIPLYLSIFVHEREKWANIDFSMV